MRLRTIASVRPAVPVLLVLLAFAAHDAGAVELYGGAGTTGVEIGATGRIGSGLAARLDASALGITRDYRAGDVDYDARLKFRTVGAYVDWFVLGGMRLTGGALIGRRTIHGVARSVGNTIVLNGVPYPVVAGDTLGFEARFPEVTPYLGLGFGHHRQDPGVHFYADAGVAWGRAKVTLSPSASLASKLNPADLASEQRLAQDKADGMRAWPVLKVGATYAF